MTELTLYMDVETRQMGFKTGLTAGSLTQLCEAVDISTSGGRFPEYAQGNQTFWARKIDLVAVEGYNG